MNIIIKIAEKIILFIVMIWLIVWSVWIILGAIMFDIYLHFIDMDSELMILKNFGNTLRKISEYLKNHKNNNVNEENTIHE